MLGPRLSDLFRIKLLFNNWPCLAGFFGILSDHEVSKRGIHRAGSIMKKSANPPRKERSDVDPQILCTLAITEVKMIKNVWDYL